MELDRRGLIDFEHAVQEEVGVFFVAKKGGRLRSVLDARRANWRFAVPESVSLCTGSSFAALELEGGEVLHIGHADLQDAFYHLGLPARLRPLFGLHRVLASAVGLTSLHGRPLPQGSCVHPRLRVVPMGWSWALWWCQFLHQRLVAEVGYSDAIRLRDRAPPVPLAASPHSEYVDNFVVFSHSGNATRQAVQSVVKVLCDRGLPVHDIAEDTTCAELLGWEVDGVSGTVRPTARRLWRARLAVRGLLKSGRASGRDIEKMVGHMSYISLVKRSGLSCFGAVYAFARKFGDSVGVLWLSVRRELRRWDGIAPLLWQDVRSESSGDATMTDASPWGLGVVAAKIPPAEAAAAGRLNERWRFTLSEEAAVARASVGLRTADSYAAQSGATASSSEEAPGVDAGGTVTRLGRAVYAWEPVSDAVLHADWKVVASAAWQYKEGMPVLEGRALLVGVRHTLRRSATFGCRVLALVDSMSAA